jgi:hypothetical protein
MSHLIQQTYYNKKKNAPKGGNLFAEIEVGLVDVLLEAK